MRHKWHYCLTQSYRRHGKTFFIVVLCLAINFIGHMFLCLPRNDDIKATRESPDALSYYSTLRKSTEPKQHHAFFVVVILTGPSYFEKRKTIRDTWLSDKPEDTIHFFVVGGKELSNEDKTALQYEKRQYNDLILLDDFHDSYFSLTAKVLRTFQWLDEHVDYQYAFKADDDTFARIDLMHNELKERRWSSRFYWGFFDGRARVKKSGQWAEKSWFLCDTYLPHARGGGYVLSKDLVQYLAINAHMLKKFNSEDVSVGAWLGPLDIERLHDPRFDTEYRSRGCSNQYLVTHKQEPRDMKEKFSLVQNTGNMCHKEFKVRNSYNYNWDALPSSCCIRDNPDIP